jgi:hypothetical protein
MATFALRNPQVIHSLFSVVINITTTSSVKNTRRRKCGWTEESTSWETPGFKFFPCYYQGSWAGYGIRTIEEGNGWGQRGNMSERQATRCRFRSAYRKVVFCRLLSPFQPTVHHYLMASVDIFYLSVCLSVVLYVCMYVCMYKGWARNPTLAPRPSMICCASPFN